MKYYAFILGCETCYTEIISENSFHSLFRIVKGKIKEKKTNLKISLTKGEGMSLNEMEHIGLISTKKIQICGANAMYMTIQLWNGHYYREYNKKWFC